MFGLELGLGSPTLSITKPLLKHQIKRNGIHALSASPSQLNCRPAVILPGLGNNSSDYQQLATFLKEYGAPVIVAKVSRFDWLRNAAGLLDANYWKGTLRPRPVLDWPPPKGLSGVIDQTRGLLDYVEKYCARAIYTPELRYVCIAGRYIQGARFFRKPSVTSKSMVKVDNDQDMSGTLARTNRTNTSASLATTIRARFIGQGYKQVCGKADVWGDGVVPEMSAHLEGALNISLEGVYHSPVGSDDTLRPWYGSPAVLEKWVHHILI